MTVSLDAYLSVSGDPVVAEERGADEGQPFWDQLLRFASWLRVERLQDGTRPRRTSLRGVRKHGAIAFIGDLESRMLEPLVETLRALATHELDFDTPAVPAQLRELAREVGTSASVPAPLELSVVVGPECPYCPRVAAAALRFAVFTPAFGVTVVRADSGLTPSVVGSVPAVVTDDRVVATGSLGEYDLLQALLRHWP